MHLSLEGLRQILAGGSSLDASRVVLHFSHGCAACQAALGELAPALGWDSSAAPVPETRSPVYRALFRLAVARRDDPARTRRVLELLRPAHALAVREAQWERLGFCRLVLEEAWEIALAELEGSDGVLRQALALLEDPRLQPLGQRRLQDLRGFGQGYLADRLERLGQEDEADWMLRQATRNQALGSGDPELSATLYELRAERLSLQRRYIQGVQLLVKAVKLLERPGLEARRAEMLFLLGRAHERMGDGPHALTALTAAASLMRQGVGPQLQLAILHNLAAVRVQCGDFAAAGKDLRQAAPLYERFANDLVASQRLWLQGVIASHTGRPRVAENQLRTAFARFLELAHQADALRVLLDLARFYIASGRDKKLEQLEPLFRRFLAQPQVRLFLRAEVRQLLQLAATKDLPAPWLAQLLAELEGLSQAPG